MAKVALKAVSGLDMDVSPFLNAVKGGIGEAVADRVWDEEVLRQVVLGKEVASTSMQVASKESYEALKTFMDEEERRNKDARPGGAYVDFRNEMKPVADEKGGMVWVSNGNAQSWKDLHPIAPSA